MCCPLFPNLVLCMFYRPSDLRLRNVSNQGLKRPSPSPTRRISQPNPPAPGYGGSPVRARRGSNPSTPTGNIYKPLQEQASSNSAVLLANHPDQASGHPVPAEISLTPTRYPRPRLRSDDYSHNKPNKKRNNRHHYLKRGNSLSLSRQRDYSSESELKIIEENIVSWGTIRAVQATMKNHGYDTDVTYPTCNNDMAQSGYRTYMHKTHGINDDITLARTFGTDSFTPMQTNISVNGLDSAQVRQHRLAEYTSRLSQFHHGSLDRNYLENLPLFARLGSEHDSRLYRAVLFSRFLVNLFLLIHLIHAKPS